MPFSFFLRKTYRAFAKECFRTAQARPARRGGVYGVCPRGLCALSCPLRGTQKTHWRTAQAREPSRGKHTAATDKLLGTKKPADESDLVQVVSLAGLCGSTAKRTRRAADYLVQRLTSNVFCAANSSGRWSVIERKSSSAEAVVALMASGLTDMS